MSSFLHNVYTRYPAKFAQAVNEYENFRLKQFKIHTLLFTILTSKPTSIHNLIDIHLVPKIILLLYHFRPYSSHSHKTPFQTHILRFRLVPWKYVYSREYSHLWTRMFADIYTPSRYKQCSRTAVWENIYTFKPGLH